MRKKVDFPENCPECKIGTLYFELNKNTTQENVVYECENCHKKYSWSEMANIMYDEGVKDSAEGRNRLEESNIQYIFPYKRRRKGQHNKSFWVNGYTRKKKEVK